MQFQFDMQLISKTPSTLSNSLSLQCFLCCKYILYVELKPTKFLTTMIMDVKSVNMTDGKQSNPKLIPPQL